MSNKKTFEAIEKLKEVELELHRLKNALEMANKIIDAKQIHLEEIAKEEREACAKVCESKMPTHVINESDRQIVQTLRDCAAAIRARSNT
jgi:hypothetical protein